MLFIYLLLLGFSSGALYGAEEKWAIAREMTPVFNTPELRSVFGGDDGKTLMTDRSGLVRATEFIAFPGTVFDVLDELDLNGRKIFSVKTADYPYSAEKGYYVDAAFLEEQGNRPRERKAVLPSLRRILKRMRSWEGERYIWGGNAPEGISSMLDHYPPSGWISRTTRDKWTLDGLDCSGLLYAATNGYTPRNTSSLVTFGDPVNIKGRTAAEIVEELEPLDLIVWDGHVIIVIDNGSVIQSRAEYLSARGGRKDGVRISQLEAGVKKLLDEREPLDEWSGHSGGEKAFVVRRWYHRAGTFEEDTVRLGEIEEELSGAQDDPERALLLLEKSNILTGRIGEGSSLAEATVPLIEAVETDPYNDEIKKELYKLYEKKWKTYDGQDRKGLREKVYSLAREYSYNENFDHLVGPYDLYPFLDMLNRRGKVVSGAEGLEQDTITAYSTEYGWFELEGSFAYYELYLVDIDNDSRKEFLLTSSDGAPESMIIEGIWEKEGGSLIYDAVSFDDQLEELVTSVLDDSVGADGYQGYIGIEVLISDRENDKVLKYGIMPLFRDDDTGDHIYYIEMLWKDRGLELLGVDVEEI